MRLMPGLPSFLTPPRSSKHATWQDDDDSDGDEEYPAKNGRGYRAQGTMSNGNSVQPTPDKRNSRPPPNAFVMPGERRNSSFTGPTSGGSSSFQGPSGQTQTTPNAIPRDPPGYSQAVEPPVNRRSTFQPETNGQPSQGYNTNGSANGSVGSLGDDLEVAKTALKDWKQCHTVFMEGFRDGYLPALQRGFSRVEPELREALRPLCGPSELQICMRHWEHETKRLSNSTVLCAKTMRELVRDAWNEMVIEEAPDGRAIIDKLRRDLDASYEIYLRALQSSKENLWHTLDFNVEYTELRYEIRESFWGVFEKLKVKKEEHACGLPVLAVPDMESPDGGAQHRAMDNRAPPPQPSRYHG